MEYTWKKIRTVLGLIVFLGCCALVVIGQKSISYAGLGLMMMGLCGIVLCLYLYNRTHR
jgi:hypothetical protein